MAEHEEDLSTRNQHLLVLASLLFAAVFTRILFYWEQVPLTRLEFRPQFVWSLAAATLAIVNWCVLWLRHADMLQRAHTALGYFATIFVLYVATARLLALPPEDPWRNEALFQSNRPTAFVLFSLLFLKYVVDAWTERPRGWTRKSGPTRRLILLRACGLVVLVVSAWCGSSAWHWPASIVGVLCVLAFFIAMYSDRFHLRTAPR